MKTKSLIAALFAVSMCASLVSCHHDADGAAGGVDIDYLNDKSNILQLFTSISPATRGTNIYEQATTLTPEQKVGITTSGAMSGTDHSNQEWDANASYGLDNKGNSVYFDNSGTEISVIAYHPYNENYTVEASGTTYYDFTVATDQTGDGYKNSDLLWTTRTVKKTQNPASLTFTHLLSKINVTLTTDGVDDMDFSKAVINICGLNIKTTFNPSTGDVKAVADENVHVQTITAGTGSTATAIIVPQTVAASTQIIKVSFSDKIFFYKLTSATTFEGEHSYSYTLKVIADKNELGVVSVRIDKWNDTSYDEVEVKEGEVYVETAGTLSTLISDAEKHQITSLKVSGNINGADLFLLRDMAGGGINASSTGGKLSVLDMEDVTLVPGDDVFYSYSDYSIEAKITSSDILPKCFLTYCNALTRVILPKNIKSIENEAFLGCKKLTRIDIPEGVESIGEKAFWECWAMESITIPSTVTSIGSEAFGYLGRDVSHLDIHCLIEEPIEIAARVFYSVTKSKSTLYVPAGSIDLYKAANVWKDFGENIVPEPGTEEGETQTEG